MSFAAMMLVAMVLDSLIGWPARLYAVIGHPVTWIGALIHWLDLALNHDAARGTSRRMAGVATALMVIGVTGGVAWALQCALPAGWLGILIGGVLAWPLLALRSMYTHVAAVVLPLQNNDLVQARFAVSMIVGRNAAVLDEAGVARAAMESLAENTSDGIVAPLFWGAILGLPGIAAYKAINTLDSMIGHRTPRFEAFGWASARIDDLVNLIPARLTGAVFALVSNAPRHAAKVMWRDAGLHRSPNAGWPEAAMAAGLGVRLSGPRVYADRVAEEPWVNAGAADPTPADLQRGLALYVRAMFVLGAALLGLALV
ncbi:adenosylcobinamide-phosphate synthase CbiB [Cypionkella sp.]|uniref:adenosylcobinamide-phosphate synthase CbiB n=1 Tax=Cypionkella sp. TaxID=2811411 RepID=UPI00272619C7|nr:adenosylcobinamide-phosphate synthase CbiB [Cypionkella sp.]MDO8986319.1 adenosylcobinamide-phosphate synthase CbiB [Cypionkella sp.]MDP2051017.1 adenosylcobinamide-phosphate synthase CbiB [Cypionkella sp.]